MAEDMYTVVLQAEFDGSPAGEAKAKQSLDRVAQRLHAEIQFLASQQSIDGINDQLAKGILPVVLKTTLDMSTVKREIQREHLKAGVTLTIEEDAYRQSVARLQAKLAKPISTITSPFFLQGASNGVGAQSLVSDPRYSAYLETTTRYYRVVAENAAKYAQQQRDVKMRTKKLLIQPQD